MGFDWQRYHRGSIRLKNHDYTSNGAYFITMCTKNREWLFGEILDGKMILNEMGQIVHDEWLKTGELRPYVKLDVFVVMPDHFHGIIQIINKNAAGNGFKPTAGNGFKPTAGNGFKPTVGNGFKPTAGNGFK
ncbi:MAG: REP-associated tyrosine transposase, partial [Candidatus Marinimicrobia bacterium]|nr:REP-associated tyrosine transposase [Candidatus Neomarinimicrobiota bacterium]